jgi:plastocyanin
MATANVSITANGAFSPQSLTVKKGTTVKWTNNSQTLHTVTTPNTFSPLNSTALMPGNTYSYTFTQVGTFPYVSLANPSMTGMVIVQQ